MKKTIIIVLIGLLFLLPGCSGQSDSAEIAIEDEKESLEAEKDVITQEELIKKREYHFLKRLLRGHPDITKVIDNYKRYLGLSLDELLAVHTYPDGMYDEYYYSFYNDGSEQFGLGDMSIFFSGSIWSPDAKTVAVSNAYYKIFPHVIASVREMDLYCETQGMLCKNAEETYLSYSFEDVVLRVYTNSEGTQLSFETQPEIILKDADNIERGARHSEGKTLVLPSETLFDEKFKSLAIYTSRLVQTKEEILSQNKNLQPVEDIGGPWYYDETWSTDAGDLHGFSGDYPGSILVSASLILPIEKGKALSRDELISHWPVSHTWEKGLYTFVFANDNDANNPICVWIPSNSDGSIDYNVKVNIKFFMGRPS